MQLLALKSCKMEKGLDHVVVVPTLLLLPRSHLQLETFDRSFTITTSNFFSTIGKLPTSTDREKTRLIILPKEYRIYGNAANQLITQRVI